ncbi:hypothetical protein B0H17DRAFT_1142513 [Mycena rosella]|uniref:Uncharacterized protein n=1 Tax=Mycena rosella TaxID=1033263 RepID=A0AAD7G7U7_MYCRO|nr:hypothetical protein B0H17DRAFT_1142513 [Mycena rosella]
MANLNKVSVAVSKQLLQEGWNPRDIKEIAGLPPFRGSSAFTVFLPSTKLGWRKARPYVIHEVLELQQHRLFKERDDRLRVVHAGISIPWWPGFVRLWRDLPNSLLTEEDARLVAELAQLPPIWTSGAPRNAWLLHHRFPAIRRHWADFWNWRRACSSVTPTTVPHSVCSAAQGLVRALGLNPGTTTPEEMDALDPRFCPDWPRRSDAMGWRECYVVERNAADPRATPHISSWGLLSPEAAADVRRQEGNDPAARDPVWLCNLCPAHFRSRATRADAVAHASDVHDIPRPRTGIHVLRYAGASRTLRQPVVLTGIEYRCNRCATELPGVVKLLSLARMKSHVQTKHNVVPTENEWIKVELVMPASHSPCSKSERETNVD